MIGHSDDHPVHRIVQTEAFRALLAPFGHISWTALLGGALFAAAAGRSFRLTPGVLGTLAGIVALHGAWDASYGWAIMIAQGVAGEGWNLTWPNTQAWIGAPTGQTLLVFQAAYDGLVAICGLVGATWIVNRWRAYGAAVPRTPAVAV